MIMEGHRPYMRECTIGLHIAHIMGGRPMVVQRIDSIQINSGGEILYPIIK